MDSLITPFQNAFLQGRQIQDNVIFAYEIFNYLRKRKKEKTRYASLKHGMNKAYDRLRWNFLKVVLLKMNYPAH